MKSIEGPCSPCVQLSIGIYSLFLWQWMECCWYETFARAVHPVLLLDPEHLSLSFYTIHLLVNISFWIYSGSNPSSGTLAVNVNLHEYDGKQEAWVMEVVWTVSFESWTVKSFLPLSQQFIKINKNENLPCLAFTRTSKVFWLTSTQPSIRCVRSVYSRQGVFSLKRKLVYHIKKDQWKVFRNVFFFFLLHGAESPRHYGKGLTLT